MPGTVKLKLTEAPGVLTVTAVPLPCPGSASIKYSARLITCDWPINEYRNRSMNAVMRIISRILIFD
jgi:hypothetical protein